MVRSLGRLDTSLGCPAHYSPRGEDDDGDTEHDNNEIWEPRETAVKDTKLLLEEAKSSEEQHREPEAYKNTPNRPPEDEAAQVLQGLNGFLFDVLDKEVSDFLEIPLDACSTKEASPRRVPHETSLLSAFSNEVGGTAQCYELVSLVHDAALEEGDHPARLQDSRSTDQVVAKLG